MRGREMVLNGHGYVAKGISVENKLEPLNVLRAWLDLSDVPTIGPVDNYGGKPWISIRLGRDRIAVLNADTKRAAVGEYVRDAEVSRSRRQSSSVSWRSRKASRCLPGRLTGLIGSTIRGRTAVPHSAASAISGCSACLIVCS